MKAIRREVEAKANFASFEPSPLSLIEEKTSKSGKLYLVLEDENSKRHYAMSGELSALQEQNADTKILVNSKGKVAAIGEEYTLSDIPIGRNADGELHIV